MFFIDDRRQPDFRWRLFSGHLHLAHGMHHRRQSGLHIARTTSVDTVTIANRFERRHRHPQGGNRIHVCFQHNSLVGVLARQLRVHVETPWQHFLGPRCHVALLKEPRNILGDFTFPRTTPLRVHTVDGNKISQCLKHVIRIVVVAGHSQNASGKKGTLIRQREVPSSYKLEAPASGYLMTRYTCSRCVHVFWRITANFALFNEYAYARVSVAVTDIVSILKRAC